MLLLFWLPMIYGYSYCDLPPDCSRETDSVDWWSSVFSGCRNVSSLVVNCSVNSIPAFALEGLPVPKLDLPNCSLSTVRWQSLFTTGDRTIDLSACPLTCSCDTSWINGHFHHLTVISPSLSSCHPGCSPSHLERINSTDPVIGQNFTVEYYIHGDVIPEFLNSTRSYFKWQMSGKGSRHGHLEVITERVLRLEITNISEQELGVVRVVCWHCRQPLFATFEVRVPAPLRVDFEPRRGDRTSGNLIVHGYPIDRLSITVTNNEGENVTSELPAPKMDRKINFWKNLHIQQETAHSLFHLRIFTIWSSCTTTDCPHDDLFGEYVFTICTLSTSPAERLLSPNNSTEEQCQSIGHHMNFVNTTTIITIPPKTMVVDHKIVVIFVLFFVVAILAVTICYKRLHEIKEIGWRKWRWSINSRLSRRTSRATEETMLRLEERVSLSSSDYTGHVIPCIKGGAVQIHEQIGKGAFGAVYCGSWEKTGPRSVAVKALQEADAEVEKEATVLCRLDHENIVRLYGLTRDGDRLLLVFEMMRLGDLRSYLKARTPQASNYAQFPAALELSELKSIIKEIAKGLCYLVAQQIVHRDLAARNCLVDGESDLLIGTPKQRPTISVKISDFGMSRRLNYDSDYYRMQNQSLLPVRWLPPEAISEHRFSPKSDIWSLGVTMWEVFSYGSVPFDTLSNHEVVSYAIAGMRPPKPRHCPLAIYELMEKCWALDPEQRITAEDVLLDHSLTDTIVGPL